MQNFFINNKFDPPLNNKNESISIVNPATELQFALVSKACPLDVDFAVKVAKEALSGPWADYSGKQRRDLLISIADDIKKHRDEYALLESRNVGKPLAEAYFDIDDSIEVFRYYAGWADKISGKSFGSLTSSNTTSHVMKEAIGVVAPAGIFNVVCGLADVGEAICTHHGIGKVSFTGSTGTGRKVLASSSSSNLKRVTLELGGKSPIVVFEDADLDLAVKECFGAAFGQNCIAGSRIFLHASIHDKFLSLLKTHILQTVKIGDPLDATKNYGPLATLHQFNLVKEFSALALTTPHIHLQIGGTPPPHPGFYFPPTIFSNVHDTDTIALTEIFGPILCVMTPFTDFDAVLARCNDTEYGLGAGVFTRDGGRAERFVRGVRVGVVYVNHYNTCEVHLPFGGVKGSGFGRDLGEEGVGEYTVEKTVSYRF